MDKKGRTRWVTAAKRASRIFMVTRGFGYTMSSPENAATIVKKQLVSLDNKVKKAEVVTNKVLVLHSNQMDKTERQSVQAVSAMFAQVRILSDAYKHEQKNLAMSKPRALGALIKGSQ